MEVKHINQTPAIIRYKQMDEMKRESEKELYQTLNSTVSMCVEYTYVHFNMFIFVPFLFIAYDHVTACTWGKYTFYIYTHT